MKPVKKLSLLQSNIEFSNKFFGNTLIIFALIPWVSFGLNNLDSQPWTFITAIIFCLFIKRIIFPKYSKKIFILVILGLIYATSITSSMDISIIRGFINYLSLPLLYVAFYNYFIRYGVPIKLFIILNFLWIFFGFIELFFPEIMSLLFKMRTTPSRGVTSLAPEATFFAIYLFFSSLLLFELKNLVNNKKFFILLIINFLAVLFLAKSSMVVLFYVISLFSFILFNDSPLTLNIFPFIGYTPIVFLSSFDNPDTIPAFAESPSHKINVHWLDLTVPAKLASINL